MKRLNGPPFWLQPNSESLAFPPVELALREPDGLLAVGGDLSPQRLMAAYAQGIFPWYGEGQPILWWSPDPRTVIFPERLHVSHSLHRLLAKNSFSVSLDQGFDEVIHACAQPRENGNGTWIIAEVIEAYRRLHSLGIAHSAECWQDGELVGGIYGVALGRVFFGESMFSRRTNASKVALVHLVQWLRDWGYGMMDCQIHSQHLASLGAECISRTEFTRLLQQWCNGDWNSNYSCREP